MRICVAAFAAFSVLSGSPAMLGAQPAQPGDSGSELDFETHIHKLQDKLPHDGFTIRIERPFVVIGDESPEVLERRCRQTIRWAVERLRRRYFAHDPDHIVDIWLFKDAESYETHVLELFGTEPGTPFGYYSARHRALVMNISTGGGTLVHELVHPFIERNFPECPSWFNEGLASLYEQCGDDDGDIRGKTNWRLAGLQRAIAADTLPAFQTLCETSTREFYREDPGTNYAQARYLCYYLQEAGKLRDYYHQFVKNVDDDPSGFDTLQAVLEISDMPPFQQQWQDYIMRLRFP
ncbi:MAG: hypothetical protein ACR2NP_22585 [Pirellulaceae bacterium]